MFTNHPLEWEEFVEEKVGSLVYKALKTRALMYGKIDYEKIIDSLSSE